MEKIGSRRPRWFIREWREYRGLTQEQVAARAEMTKSAISMFESGKKRLNDDHIAALAFAFDVNPAEMMRDPAAPTREELLRGLDEQGVNEVLRFIDFTRSKKAG